MLCVVHMARKGSPLSTITMSRAVRVAVSLAHGGAPVEPGLAVSVEGAADRAIRNLVVLRMREDDRLLRVPAVVRIGSEGRRRLGVEVGQPVSVTPLPKWETWYHGTRAPDPMALVRQGLVVGPRAGFGSGIYLSSDEAYSRLFAATGLLVCQVAWGQALNWPLAPGDLRNDFSRWCGEHSVDADRLLGLNPWFDGNGNFADNYVRPDGGVDSYICRWARLNGHYFPAERGESYARVFPGPVGRGFKPHRLRIIKVLAPDGTVLFTRGQRE